ncbi:hypothetical protein B0H13DRAFT_1873065 [Mycena leptocephala]|nr:hypothetical protein B0H13DRAFT_1873065 [Mycena leptocephala]
MAKNKEKNKKNLKTPAEVFTIDSTMTCDKCGMVVKVGLAVQHNLDQHKKSKCTGPDTSRKIDEMFVRKPMPRLVPRTVTTPPAVNRFFEHFVPLVTLPMPTSGAYPAPTHISFARLREKMNQIPYTNPWATDDHPLSIFATNPKEFFQSTHRTWVGTLHLLLTEFFNGNISGESPNFDVEELRPLLNRGPRGLDGFCKFFDYFLQIGFPVECLQVPVTLLEHAIDIEFPSSISDDDVGAADSLLPLHLPEYQDLDIDSPDDDHVKPAQTQRHCQGLKIDFPPGKNAHTSYPFGLHGSGLPWGYYSIGDDFYLRANTYSSDALGAGNTECIKCKALLSHKQLEGILRRIEYGVHENSPLVFHPVLGLMEIARRRSEQARGMRLMKLNDTCTIGRKMAAIDDYKELTMAIASGKMARVGNLLESGLANHAGVRGLVGLCLRANVGKLKLVTVHWVSQVFPRFGAIQTICPLLPSPGKPTIEEIEANIDSCLDATAEFSASKSQGMPVRIVHQILMLDEIATEKRARYDDRNNKVVGVCRQHGHKLPLELRSEEGSLRQYKYCLDM